MKSGARSKLAFRPDPAFVGQDDVLHNSQPQTGAARVARTGFIDAIEALEDAVQMLRSDAGTEVLHKKFNFIFEAAGADENPLARLAVFQRVLDQVAEDLVHRI